MSKDVMYLITCVMLAAACVCESTLHTSWRSGNYPNPHTSPTDCGRPAKKLSWICDPNRIITADEARVLDYMMEAIASNRSVTPCPCSAHQCRADDSGYKVAIALMNKMDLPTDFKTLTVEEKRTATVDAAREFAYNLMVDKWSFGQCEESVVILYSKQDNIIFMMSGDTAQLKLTDKVMKDITDFAGPYFAPKEDVSVGLKHMVIHLRNVFNDNFYGVNEIYGRGGVSTLSAHVFLLLPTLLTSMFATLHLL